MGQRVLLADADLLIVDESSIGAAQVGDRENTISESDDRVLPADVLLWDRNIIVVRPSDAGSGPLHQNTLSALAGVGIFPN
jgi:hypothetical protein